MNRTPRATGPGIAGVALLLALSGCSMLGLTTESTTTGSGDAGAAAGDWTTRVLDGPRAASPTPGAPISPTPTSVLTLDPLPSASVSPLPPECRGNLRPNVLNGLTVTPGAGQAKVTWVNVGDPAVQSYRLAAIPQTIYYGEQAPANWKDVPAGDGCNTITQTVTGLKKGEPYIFWLDAIVNSYEYGQGRDVQIARSTPIIIL
ncbi:hypothetical protein J2S43_005008 [Catenuloplanes nepalensis]|uniref:Fibronectin type-III domain-containing protein n=1 Tax=Catenuloplanes nepalensis TaxID=587533 RepID=A0ABT9MYH8_9ACTN|nr:hypothetical protein [Catenuloplanes nepalensis]MDP9796496.1 hypothetical protein [Catenuloplanes nepalensis]